MQLNDNMQIIRQLKKLGFDLITDEVNSNINAGYKKFTIILSNRIDDDSLLYALKFEKAENKIILAGYGLTMQSIVIPKVLIKGIDTAELEARMKGKDKLIFELFFEKDVSQGTYNLLYYDAVLQKETPLIDTVVNGINTTNLEKSMVEIDWKKRFRFCYQKAIEFGR